MSKVRLYCFTYAGGTASFYDEIEKDLTDLKLIKIEYPGHGSRHKEPFAKDYDELANDAYRIVKEKHDGSKYGLFGYSMGAITVIEVLKRILADAEIPDPSHIFLAAHEPHSKMELDGFTEDKLDTWIKERTMQFGGIPEQLAQNKTFWRMYLPVYRADYTLIKNYRFEEMNLRTLISADIFYSETDTPRSEMEKWRDYFIGRCDYHPFEGNHFFLREQHLAIAQVIRNKLNQDRKNDI